MKKSIILASLLLCLGTNLSNAQSVGGNKDRHGCLTSAGYTYSSLKKDCIKIFEQEIMLKNANPADANGTQTCIIFSKDNKKAEVFLDGKDLVLNRMGKKGHYVWKNGAVEVGNNKGYFIKKSGIVVYSQSK